MKKTIILLMLAFLPTLLMAQAAGAHVVRKPKPTAVAPKPKPTPKPNPKQRVQHRTEPIAHQPVYQHQTQSLPPVIQNLVNNMVYVKGGAFTMGATSEQGGDTDDDEKPAHKVTLSSFSIGKYEVTQEEWEAVMGNNPSYYKGAKRPVERVSWDDCQTFIRKLNQLTGKQFRLPTEAEWEYAARGGNRSHGYKYSGSDNIGSVAWCDENSGDTTHPVGQKQANELGLYDMSGNVDEWCKDWIGDYSSSSQTNPKGPSSGSFRVLRGGSWILNAGHCRVSRRGGNTPDDRLDNFGLRLALEVPETSSQPRLPDPSSQSSSAGLPPVIQNLVNNMVNVEGGTFTMGATSEQGSDVGGDEEPAHKVTLSSFSIGRYEVTQEEWEAVMGSNPSSDKDAKRPVEQVSWDDCQKFIRKLNALTGKQFRLPTEAEWEYAARGGDRSRAYKYAGSNHIGSVAWSYNNSGDTHPVGQKQANELGLYDMSGNVWEWCQDWYGENYYGSSPSQNPKGPSTGSVRVYRGGSCYSVVGNCRVSHRNYYAPDIRDFDLGLRLAL